jgi:hypothetical protein
MATSQRREGTFAQADGPLSARGTCGCRGDGTDVRNPRASRLFRISYVLSLNDNRTKARCSQSGAIRLRMTQRSPHDGSVYIGAPPSRWIFVRPDAGGLRACSSTRLSALGRARGSRGPTCAMRGPAEDVTGVARHGGGSLGRHTLVAVDAIGSRRAGQRKDGAYALTARRGRWAKRRRSPCPETIERRRIWRTIRT